MHKLNRFIAVLAFAGGIAIAGPTTASAGWYYGIGPSYALPLGNVADTTTAAFGGHLLVESRHFCRLWFGLRADYFLFGQSNAVQFDAEFYREAFYISPACRFNFVGDDCYQIELSPYVQGMLTLSSMENNDARSRLGLGGAVGLGVAYKLKLMDICFIIDLHGHYSAPNFLAAADGRPKMNSINTGLSLSVTP